MKQYALLGAAACLLSMGLFGCSNTAEGVKQDASQDGQKVAQATNEAVDATKQAATNAADATKKAADSAGQAVASAAQDAGQAAKNATKDATQAVDSAGTTSKVKLAIVADKDLNDTKNLINVDTKDDVVHLKGHVQNNAEKKKATEVADKALKDMNATAKVSNELTVEAH